MSLNWVLAKIFKNKRVRVRIKVDIFIFSVGGDGDYPTWVEPLIPPPEVGYNHPHCRWWTVTIFSEFLPLFLGRDHQKYPKNFWLKKNHRSKIFLVKKKLWLTKSLVKTQLWWEKNLWKKFWWKNMLVKNIFGKKNCFTKAIVFNSTWLYFLFHKILWYFLNHWH